MTALPRGLVIAAPRSGSGKTTVTLGLLRALSRAGTTVTGMKCGPDYIDPAFHARACGRPSLNLDSWAMELPALAALAAEADGATVLCEGLMGLFDGVPAPAGRSGSTADVAAALGWPVLLVHDASGQAQSAAAQIAGCLAYDPRIRVAGVILNRVGSLRHRRLIEEALAPLGVPVVAALPKAPHLALPERHLGLVQAGELADLEAKLDAMADFVAAHLSLADVMGLADRREGPPAPADALPPLRPPGQRIALAQDQAFSFIYPHVLAGWRRLGAEILPFSPLADEPPSDAADACWLPGGYPELHGGRLAAATRFLSGLRGFAETRPVHGECGGYMVLGRQLTDADGRVHPMAGLLSVATSFARRTLHLGYREATLLAPCCLGSAGMRLRGHEFHYATVVDAGQDDALAEVRTAYDDLPAPAGSRRSLVTGSFFHAIAAAR